MSLPAVPPATPDLLDVLRWAHKLGIRAPEGELYYQLHKHDHPAGRSPLDFNRALRTLRNDRHVLVERTVYITPRGLQAAGLPYVYTREPVLDTRHSPLTLGDVAADQQALRLRARGYSYGHIQMVMSDYHGQHRSVHAWKQRLRRLGAPPKPHGRPFPKQAAA